MLHRHYKMSIHSKSTKRKSSRSVKKRFKSIQLIYLISAVLWIVIVYALRAYKHLSAIAVLILSFPVFVFALGFLNKDIVNCRKDKSRLGVDYLAFGILFVGIIFNISHLKKQHFTTAIMFAGLMLLILSSATIPISRKNKDLVNTIQLIMLTAALTLLVYVLYVIIARRVPVSEQAHMHAHQQIKNNMGL